MPKVPQENGKPQQNVWRQIGKYSHLAFILPVSVVVGIVIGTALDHRFGTRWMAIAGLLLGCVAGFFELIRTIVNASKES
jgi:F0F1-type ATP synthase assembly protein I